MQKLLKLERNESKFARTVKKIDFLGEQTQFQIDGNDRYQTLLGSCCSFIIIFFTVFSSVFFLKKIIDTSQPDINTVITKSQTTRLIDLREYNFYPAIVLSGSAGFIDSNKIATIKASITKKKFVEDVDGNIVGADFEDYPIQYSPCADVKEYYPYAADFGKVGQTIFSRGFCFVPDENLNYVVNGTTFSKDEFTLELEVFPCSLADQSQCVPAALIHEAVVVLIYPIVNINTSRIDDFEKQVSSPHIVNFNTKISTTQRISLNFQDVYDVEQLYQGAQFRSSSITSGETQSISSYRDEAQITCTAAELNSDPPTCKSYLTFEFSAGTSSTTITRNYQDPLSALAEVGGFMEIMITIFGGIYLFYNRMALSRYLVSKIYLKKVPGKEQTSKDEHEVYEDNLYDNFDIVTLAKETNALKILNLAHFEDYHLVLLPKVLRAIKRQEMKVKKRELALKRTTSQFKKFGLDKNTKTITENSFKIQKTLSPHTAMEKLFANKSKKSRNTGNSSSRGCNCNCSCGNDQTRDRIDEIFKTYINMDKAYESEEWPSGLQNAVENVNVTQSDPLDVESNNQSLIHDKSEGNKTRNSIFDSSSVRKLNIVSRQRKSGILKFSQDPGVQKFPENNKFKTANLKI